VRLALVEVLSEGRQAVVLDDPTVGLTRAQAIRLALHLGRKVEQQGEKLQLIIASSDSEFAALLWKYASSHYEVVCSDGVSSIGAKGSS
jgi:energy-coupling factor transporter ATP-binding protein EcfA2